MKTKEEIIQALRGSKIVMINTGNPRNAEYIQHAINYIESMPKIHEELSTLNPNKIDEERFYKIWNKKDISEIEDILSEYNSTCKDHQVLQPLPENPPDWFNKMFNWASPEDSRKIWSEIINHYGTPTKKELVSVDELSRSIYNNSNTLNMNECTLVAQNLVNTYSLNPPKSDEWYEKAIPNVTEYVCDNTVHVFTDYYIETHGRRVWIQSNALGHLLSDCTPYHEPSLHDKVKEKLGIELYDEFMKEVKGA